MLRYKTETRPGLVALYDIRPGNGAGPFLQPRSQHGANTYVFVCFASGYCTGCLMNNMCIQGVITSIDYCAATHQFCSSSDDRSIRLWSCTSHDVRQQHRWDSCDFTETRQLYGHMARVWQARLLTHSIVSISEVCICSAESIISHCCVLKLQQLINCNFTTVLDSHNPQFQQ